MRRMKCEIIAVNLKTFQCSQARRIIGDFGIPISILVFVMMDCSIPDTYTQVTLFKVTLYLLSISYLVDLSVSNYLTFNRKSLENPWYNK